MFEKPSSPKVFEGLLSRMRYLYGVIVLSVFVFLSFICVYLMTMVGLFESKTLVASSIFLVIAIFAQIFILEYIINQYPTITLAESGLSLSFNFRTLFIEWKDITAVRGYKSLNVHRIYVCSSKLPLLYHAYGLEIFLTHRAFVIDPTMAREDIREIIEKIKRKAPKATISIAGSG